MFGNYDVGPEMIGLDGHGSVMMVALICGFPKVGDPQDHGLQYENSH